MKASNVLKLNVWIQGKRQWIHLERPSQAQVAGQATLDLGFKVGITSLRDIMIANGIHTRRQTKHAAKILSLEEDVANLTATIVKLVTSSTVPDWLLQELEQQEWTVPVKTAVEKKLLCC